MLCPSAAPRARQSLRLTVRYGLVTGPDSPLNSVAARELLITKLLAPSPEFEPDSKMVVFDIVVYQG